MSTNQTVQTQPSFIYRAVQALFGLLTVGFLAGGFEGAVNGDFLFPFGFVLAATFGLLSLVFQFSLGTENVHVVKTVEKTSA